MPRKLVARSHREAYDLWATHFADPALMANRDAGTTRRKLERLVSTLPLKVDSRVLDVGPGDGTLFRLIAHRVGRCTGVDPSGNAVARLCQLFRDLSNVEFVQGSAESIPAPDGAFDVVVVNSVLQILPGIEEFERALAELVRVCRAGGVVFIGELPFRSELDRGLWVHQSRKIREYGLRNYLRLVGKVYVRPLLRGEPMLLYPATPDDALGHVAREQFEELCAKLRVAVECRRHRELARESSTRNDYWLRLPQPPDPPRLKHESNQPREATSRPSSSPAMSVAARSPPGT